MGKASRRKNRQGRAPDQLRYSKSGATVTEVFADGSKTVHVSTELAEMLREHLAWVREDFPVRFGRELRGDDPLFYDLNAATPQPVDERELTRQTLAVLEEVGIAREYQYAFAVTGMLVSEENESLFSDDDLLEWDLAVGEYERVGEAGLAMYR